MGKKYIKRYNPETGANPNLPLRKEFAKKLVGQKVLVDTLMGGYRPETDPDSDRVVYLPLPEYNISLRFYRDK